MSRLNKRLVLRSPGYKNRRFGFGRVEKDKKERGQLLTSFKI